MNHENKMQSGSGCSDNAGMLPVCAPLAAPYVPFQKDNPQIYQAPTGLIRGTMFPGLDLPFMGMVNQKEKNGTQLNRLQGLNFAISELGLYLDTHRDDDDALELFNQYVNLYADMLQKYEQEHGTMTQMGAGMTGRYTWTEGPWPWEYDANKEG